MGALLALSANWANDPSFLTMVRDRIFRRRDGAMAGCHMVVRDRIFRRRDGAMAGCHPFR